MIDIISNIVIRIEDYLQTGGMVMVPLVIASLIMWLLIMDRVLFFRRLHRKNMSFQIAQAHVSANRTPDPARYGGAISLLVARFIAARSGDDVLDRYILDETVLNLNRSMTDYV